MVVPESVFVQVGLEKLLANGMVHATDPTLNQRPEALNGVGMNVPDDVDLAAVVDAPVVVTTNPRNRVVGSKLIGVDGASRKDVLLNDATQGSGGCVGDGFGDYAPLTFDNSQDRSFLLVSPHGSSDSALSPSTEESFIDFNRSVEVVIIFLKKLTDFVAHSPSCFVGNASFSLNLFGRNTTPSRGHHENSVEPKSQRSSRFVKDGPSCGVNMISAGVTRI